MASFSTKRCRGSGVKDSATYRATGRAEITSVTATTICTAWCAVIQREQSGSICPFGWVWATCRIPVSNTSAIQTMPRMDTQEGPVPRFAVTKRTFKDYNVKGIAFAKCSVCAGFVRIIGRLQGQSSFPFLR